MKAANVHGAGEVFASISLRFGLRGQYGPCTPLTLGIATLSGREGMYSSGSMVLSSLSASQSSASAEAGCTEDLREEVVELVVGADDFLLTITCVRTFLRLESLEAAPLPAAMSCRRKGCCIEASLLYGETIRVSESV